MLNSIRNEEFWDMRALTDPISAILSGTSEHDFWNIKPEYHWLNDLDGSEVFVDIGCGIGRIGKWVSPLVKHYHGVDISEEMLKIAREVFTRHRNTTFWKSEQNLRMFNDNEVDIAFTCLVFQHIGLEKSLSYIEDVKRILRPGGCFYCYNIPNANSYVDGFTLEDVNRAFSDFLLTFFQQGPNYFICEAVNV